MPVAGLSLRLLSTGVIIPEEEIWKYNQGDDYLNSSMQELSLSFHYSTSKVSR